jgi:hypothetical protein
MKEATGEFKISFGKEDAYRQREPGKLTHADGDQEFSGDISGSGHVEWLMSYGADGTATYVGLQEIDGTLDGRKGGFVLTATGHFDGKQSEGEWTIVPGSGKGDLEGIRGHGGFKAGPGPQATFRLSYEL